MNTDTTTIAAALSAPFDPADLHWKPQAVSGSRCLAVCYVDARAVMDRLDEVLGVDGWQDSYRVLDGGAVVCRLRLRLGDVWIAKMDVGSPSEQPDDGDRMKAGFSDALKRTATKVGVGRYLYRLPKQWTDYDPQKKIITRTPTLPPEALPVKPRQPAPEPPPAPRNGTTNANGRIDRNAALFILKQATEQRGWQPGELREHLQKRFRVEFLKDLTPAQASELQAELEEE